MYTTSKANIHDLFGSFQGKRILVIGDTMIDTYIWGRVDRISPEAPVPVVAVHNREYRMGGAANVALNIRNLGGTPIICTMTGGDEKGELFSRLLKEEHISDEGIVKSSNRITTVKFRIIGNNVQMLRVDEESSQALTDKETEVLLKRIKDVAHNHRPDAIVFEDYDKGVIGPYLIQQVISLAREMDIPVAVDPKRNNFWAYRDITLFKPNMKELKEGLNREKSLSDEELLSEALPFFQKQQNIQTLMVTLSEKGIHYRHNNQNEEPVSETIPAHVRQIADVSGAGDTVIGTAALCLAAGSSTPLMVSLCNLAGGLVCEQVGVVAVDREKLLNEALKHICNQT